ncbi:alpha/beta fold hydrolase [Manganibacter manganicus]|uniref:Hydrolase n=1 Tax=Manganibacter manganicus TaxID=1873176 RepID=A0A1V8RL79_9HYPH|nr:alpha/beta hydrolase [Pseudaminobacter manganicus]OQM73863.1 hydrolase [Pseudaminobacter manganicus]
MKVASNGISIHIEEQGDGDLSLVFLHYWGGSSRTWRHVTAGLAPRFHTIAIDHRGWGESDAPGDGYGLGDLAADAEGVIKARNLQRYVLVGHSMGGKVAQLMASRRPDGLVGLVLVAPSPPTPMAIPEEARAMMASSYDDRQMIEATIDKVLTAKALATEDREQVIADSLRGALSAKQAWPRATSQEDITAQVEAINVPTLVIAGELDGVDSPAVLQAELLTRVPQAVMHVLPDTGHLSMLESAEELVPLIERFCRPLSYLSCGD